MGKGRYNVNHLRQMVMRWFRKCKKAEGRIEDEFISDIRHETNYDYLSKTEHDYNEF